MFAVSGGGGERGRWRVGGNGGGRIGDGSGSLEDFVGHVRKGCCDCAVDEFESLGCVDEGALETAGTLGGFDVRAGPCERAEAIEDVGTVGELPSCKAERLPGGRAGATRAPIDPFLAGCEALDESWAFWVGAGHERKVGAVHCLDAERVGTSALASHGPRTERVVRATSSLCDWNDGVFGVVVRWWLHGECEGAQGT